MRQHRGRTVFWFAGVLAAGAIVGCQDAAAPGPRVTGIQVARHGSSDPEVTGTDPTGAPQDTTLDVEVSGSGFDDASTVQLTLAGVATDKVRTNSTRYRNPKTLIANITIAADADVDYYDVEVTTASRKKGIGSEMFEVFVKDRGNAPSALVEFAEPDPEDPQDVADAYNLRSLEQAMWGQGTGQRWDYNLDVHPFALTLAFSAAELDPATWQSITDPAKKADCEEVSRRLHLLQEQMQPLVGTLSFIYDLGDYGSATISFEAVVGDFKYKFLNWSCTDCYTQEGLPHLTVSETIQDGRLRTTFQVREAGLTVYKTRADRQSSREKNPPSCGGILDYVLTVTE